MREPTPWEKLDGVKHTLDLVLESAVTWERERTAEAIEQFVIQESARLNSESMGEAHWAYLEGIKAALNLIKGEQK